MREVFHEAAAELDEGRPVVVATVVRTKGSTPQKPGAKLLVRDDGSGVGTLGGGCVEGDIWFAAKELMRRGGSAQYRDYELNEDLAAEDGLVCGGTMYFLIDPVYEAGSYLDYAREIDAAYAGGPAVALATVTAMGDGAGRLGARLFIREDGSTEGTLGSPEMDREAMKRAREPDGPRQERVRDHEGRPGVLRRGVHDPAADGAVRRRPRLQGDSAPGGHTGVQGVRDRRPGRSSPTPTASPRRTSSWPRSPSRPCRSYPSTRIRSSSSPRGATGTTTWRWRRRR